MVKKLFKHEFLAYARVMSVVYIILLTIATAGRVIQFFENDSIPYTIISTISGITYGFSVFAVFAFAFVMGIIRFYKNLFTSEGYLSFTLPVTASQHIVVKAVTAISVELVTLVVVLLSGCILAAGEMLVEIWKALRYILEKIFELAGAHTVIIGGELAILLLLELFAGIMLYYAFISIGQLFKKNRILAAVGAYFVYYIITQIVSTVLFISLSLIATTNFFGDFIFRLINQVTLHPYASIHFGIWLIVLLQAIFIWIEFLVVKKILTKKLNLE